MPTGEIRGCEERTQHAELNAGGRCYCGYRKYPAKEPPRNGAGKADTTGRRPCSKDGR